MSRWAAFHQCPDCERVLKPFDHYTDVCRYCGQLVPNAERAARRVAAIFAPDPVATTSPVTAGPVPLLRTSTAGKRKSRPGPGQGVLV